MDEHELPSANDNSDARLLELEADNRRLRQLLEARDAPGELRHRLRSTVAMMRTIIRSSAGKKRGIEEYSAHLEDRLDALARAQIAADEYGTVDIYNLLAEELRYYEIEEGPLLTLSGPRVELQPRAGQVFALAVHELAVNAVEHGALGMGEGRLIVDWAVSGSTQEPWLTFTWKELESRSSTPGTTGFGTEVLTQTLSYEFKARTTVLFEPDGLACTITIPLTPRFGKVTTLDTGD